MGQHCHQTIPCLSAHFPMFHGVLAFPAVAASPELHFLQKCNFVHCTPKGRTSFFRRTNFQKSPDLNLMHPLCFVRKLMAGVSFAKLRVRLVDCAPAECAHCVQHIDVLRSARTRSNPNPVETLCWWNVWIHPRGVISLFRGSIRS